MNPRAGIRSSRIFWVALLLVSSVLFLLPQQAAVGERIEFSQPDSGKEGSLPKTQLPDDLMSQPFRFRSNDQSTSALEPAMPSPSSKSNARPGSEDDNNWMTKPGPMDKGAVIERILKIRDYDPSKRGKQQQKTEGSLDQLWSDKKNDQKLGGKTTGTNEKDPLKDRFNQKGYQDYQDDKYDLDEDSKFKSGTGDTLEKTLGRTRFDAPVDHFSGLQSGLESGAFPKPGFDRDPSRLTVGNSTAATKATDHSNDDFQKLLGTKRLAVDQILDPLGSRSDTTRREINPVIGNSMEKSSLNAGFSDPLAGARSAPGPGSGRFDVLESLQQNRGLGASSASVSLPTAVVSPAPQPLFRSSSPVFEIPRRRF